MEPRRGALGAVGGALQVFDTGKQMLHIGMTEAQVISTAGKQQKTIKPV
jgi:hypothetical protein